jgi:hypothetical protein
VTFTWNLTGGSLVYLTAEPELPPNWTYSVDPPVGAFFETPHIVRVNITAPPDAREGDMGRVTLRAYKNSTGTMIWQFIYFASTDNKPPTVEHIEMPIFTPDGHLIFNATVKDSSGIDMVFLHYSIDGSPWENTTMQWASGDTFNSTQYTVQGFFGTSPKTVQYYVSARDWFGNQTISPTRTITVMNDIAIISAVSNETYVQPGTNFTLSLTVRNQGTLPLSFANIAIYANSTLVATRPMFNLLNGTSTNLNISLNLPLGRYVITAFATCLPDEANTANNARSDMVTVSLLGDVNLDWKVDLRDVYAVGRAFGAVPGSKNWNVVYDLNGDGKVDLRDYFTTCKNYGKSL